MAVWDAGGGAGALVEGSVVQGVDESKQLGKRPVRQDEGGDWGEGEELTEDVGAGTLGGWGLGKDEGGLS